MSASIGSGLFAKQNAVLQHLLQTGGIPREVADVRLDVAAVLRPLKATAIEEYDAPPAAVAAAIMPATATAVAPTTYRLAQLSGSVGQGAISPPRNITVTTAGTTPTHAPASVTIIGLDVHGNPISETITGVNGGAATYSGIKCFGKVTSVVTAAATGTDATLSVDTGIVIGLAWAPKLRTGQAVGLIGKELVDGAVVLTGVLTTVAAHPPYGAYTPATAPNGAHQYAIDYEMDASLVPSASVQPAGMIGMQPPP